MFISTFWPAVSLMRMYLEWIKSGYYLSSWVKVFLQGLHLCFDAFQWLLFLKMPVSTPLNLKPENPHGSLVYETGHEYLWDTQAGGATHSFLHNSFIGMYFTHTMYPLKVYNLMFSSLVTDLCTNEFSNIFITPQRSPVCIRSHFPFPHTSPRLQLPPVTGNLWVTFWLYGIFLFRTFHLNRTIQYVVFCYWLLSLGMLFLRFIHRVACICTLLLLLNNISLD